MLLQVLKYELTPLEIFPVFTGLSCRECPSSMGLPGLSLADLHSLVQCLSLPHLLQILKHFSLLKKVFRNALPTVSFQMTFDSYN